MPLCVHACKAPDFRACTRTGSSMAYSCRYILDSLYIRIHEVVDKGCPQVASYRQGLSITFSHEETMTCSQRNCILAGRGVRIVEQGQYGSAEEQTPAFPPIFQSRTACDELVKVKTCKLYKESIGLGIRIQSHGFLTAFIL